MKNLLGLILLLCSSSLAWGQAPKSQPQTQQAAPDHHLSFEIDKSLVENIYNEKIHSYAHEGHQDSGTFAIGTGVGVLNLAEMSLRNDYFDVRYSESLDHIFMFNIYLSQTLYKTNNFYLQANQSLAYGFVQDLIRVKSSSGVFSEDEISMQYLPLAGALHLGAKNVLMQGSALEFFVGGGSSWHEQSGNLDGVSESFAIPFLKSGARVSYELSQSRYAILLQYSRIRSLEQKHTTEASQVDLGTKFEI
jgi:hypothetical protein